MPLNGPARSTTATPPFAGSVITAANTASIPIRLAPGVPLPAVTSSLSWARFAIPGEEKTSSRVQAVCDWFGPSDLLIMPPNTVAQSNGALLLGATVYKVPDKANDASALHHVSKDDPPFLIMHGAQKTPAPPSSNPKDCTAR
jgi:hypothetical protein